MKRLFTIIAAGLLTATILAQSPQKMSYQAVIRNSSDQLVTNHTIGMRISILQGSAAGIPVYVETQTPATNANGLVTIEIGAGTIVTGTFAAIDWSTGNYFIKTETDPSGSTSYTITGTSQLLSVPYSLHAKTVESYSETDPVFVAHVSNGITGTSITNWNTAYGWGNHADLYRPVSWVPVWTDVTAKPVFATVATSGSYSDLSDKPVIDGSETKLTAGKNITITGNGSSGTPYITSVKKSDFYLGQDTLGGIVYYIYLDSHGNQHGLIVSKTESTAQWQTANSTTNADRSWDGAYNTALMTNSPAATYITGLGAGWYLPSIDELNLLWQTRFHINKAMNIGGFTLLSKTAIYWSSTESSSNGAWLFNFTYFNGGYSLKNETYSVRAVRAF